MSSVRWAGTCAPSARASATVSSRPSGLRSVRYSSAPCAANRKAVARPMPLAAPVTRHRFPAKYRPDSLRAMAVDHTALLLAATPERIQPQLLEHAHPALHVVAFATDHDRVAGQHQRGGARQGAHQGGDVIADRIGRPGPHL